MDGRVNEGVLRLLVNALAKDERLFAATGLRLSDVIPTGSPYNMVEAVPA